MRDQAARLSLALQACVLSLEQLVPGIDGCAVVAADGEVLAAGSCAAKLIEEAGVGCVGAQAVGGCRGPIVEVWWPVGATRDADVAVLLYRHTDPAAYRLTPRQHEVLTLLDQALTTVAVAHRLGLSPRTVEHHISAIYGALGVHDRLSALRAARRARLLSALSGEKYPWTLPVGREDAGSTREHGPERSNDDG